MCQNAVQSVEEQESLSDFRQHLNVHTQDENHAINKQSNSYVKIYPDILHVIPAEVPQSMAEKEAQGVSI